MRIKPMAFERLYGVTVAGSFALAGRVAEGPADLTFTEGEVRRCSGAGASVENEIGRLAVGETVLTSVHDAGIAGWSLLFHGVAEMVVDVSATSVRVHRDPDGDRGMIEVLVAGPVLAMVLALRGVPCLHASAVAVDGAAVAFAGTSGAGKTTLAGLCCALGAELVADDTLRLDLSTGPPSCIPGGREIRLRPGAAVVAAALGDHPQRLTADGRTAVLVGPEELDPLPLRLVLIPVLGDHEVGVRQLVGADATSALLAASRVGSLRTASALEAALDLAASVARAVPILEVRLSRGAMAPGLLPRELIELVGLST